MKKLTTVLAASLFLTCLAGCSEPVTYSVSYDGNGATAGNVPVDSKAYKANEEATVLANESLVRDDFEFVNWNTTADGSGTGYVADAKFSVTADTVLYAQWNKVKFEVKYDGNGSTSGVVPVDPGRYSSGDKAAVLGSETLAMNDHNFVCWNTKADGSGDSYNVGDELDIAGDVTLYAQWDGKWYVKANEALSAQGASAPLNGIGAWLEKNGAEVSYEIVDYGDEQIVHAFAVTYDEEGKAISSVLFADLYSEIFESKNWGIEFLDDSAYAFGGLSGGLFARANPETNKFAVMEFMYIQEDSMMSFFGGQPGLEFYFYIEQGYNAADATNLLVTGLPRLGLEDANLLVDGADLSDISDTFIVNANLTNPVSDKLDEMGEIYDFYGVEYNVLDGVLSLPDSVATDDAMALSDSELLLSFADFVIASDWEEIEINEGYMGHMASFACGDDFTANVIVAEDTDFGGYISVVDVACINPDLVKFLSYSLTAFSYDMDFDAVAKFASKINTEEFVVIDKFVDSFGLFVMSKDELEDEQIIEIDAYDDGCGSFIIDVEPYNKPMDVYPVDPIKSLLSEEFKTEIPTFEFDLAWVVDASKEDDPFVAIAALDPVMNPSKTNPSLLTLVYNEMSSHSDEWTLEVLSQEDGDYYVFTSVEQNSKAEQLCMVICESDNQLVIEYSMTLAPREWSAISDQIAAFISDAGFESAVLPSGGDEKIWNITEDHEWEDSLTISAEDLDGTIFESYCASLAADTTNWVCDDSDIASGYFYATSVEVLSNGKAIKVQVSNKGEHTYIYVYFAYLPMPLDVEGINEKCAAFGFNDILDEAAKDYLVDPSYSEYYDYGEDGLYIYEFIEFSENPFEHLVEYYTAQGYEVDDSDADWGYMYFEKISGDYYIWIMVSDFMDGESCELSISIGYVEEE